MTEAAPQNSFLDRTFERLRRTWQDVRDGAVALVEGDDIPAGLPAGKLAAVKRRIALCIEGSGGDYAARARTADLGRLYLSLSADGRHRFLRLLADDFGTDEAGVAAAIRAWRDSPDPAMHSRAGRALRDALVPPREKLLRQFNALPQGVKFLVDLRSDLLEIARENPALAALDGELRALLESWFDLGFLDLRQITWDSAASLLEKLIAYEAVHEIRSWDDLRGRLESDRRCFALFHPRMPDEPLAFVEVALVKGLSGNIQNLIDPEGNGSRAPSDDEADTAIFYSISNTQKGLQGISFGEHLIKKAVETLTHDVPSLKTFATLSPVPGFRRWLDSYWSTGTHDEAEEALYAALQSSAQGDRPAAPSGMSGPGTPDIQTFVFQTAGRYFSQRNEKGLPIDPVARFHLRNGARLERFNWPGDQSRKGWNESYGLMVNYRYDLRHLEDNHEAYVRDGEIAAARPVRDLMRHGAATA